MIPYSRQEITTDDIDAVTRALESDFLTQGPLVQEFESAVSKLLGAKYAVAVNSATSALHIACMALNLKSGDWLWTSPNSFVASANCGLYCGAKIDFVDINPDTYNLDTESLKEKLCRAENLGVLPKIIVAVHFAGQSCDMRELRSLANRYNFKIIEDASHAIGGMYCGEYIGNCRFSDITVFSLHPVKIITSGEGGIALTNDENLRRKMELLRSHGITRESARMSKQDGPWYYEQQLLGYNYRLTDFQSALGMSQLTRLNQHVAARQYLAKQYDELLADLPLQTPLVKSGNLSSFHLYVVRLRLSDIHITRRMIFDSMRAKGIGVNVHYIPIHIQPFYTRLGFRSGDFPESESYYEEAITLPLYPNLRPDDQERIIEVLRSILLS